jgi:hypothetical protein
MITAVSGRRSGTLTSIPTRDDRGSFAGVGFSIVNEHGEPIVTFGYFDPTDAANARALIEQAIVGAALIAAAGAHE